MVMRDKFRGAFRSMEATPVPTNIVFDGGTKSTTLNMGILHDGL